MSAEGEDGSSASNGLLLPLNRGDEVWLEVRRGRLDSADGVNTFSGFRLGDIAATDVEGDRRRDPEPQAAEDPLPALIYPGRRRKPPQGEHFMNRDRWVSCFALRREGDGSR